MLRHDNLEFLFADGLAYLLHGSGDVLALDLATAVGVELTEKGFHLVFSQILLRVDCCHQEVRVVNLFVAQVVNLLDYVLDFFLR